VNDDLARHWSLDPSFAFLNHGSFGACPLEVLAYQQELRARLERQPVQFMGRDLEGLLDAARADLARFVGADPADVVFVPNATTGVNTVLGSWRFAPGDELLVSDHAYPACRNALDRVAARTGACVVVARVPFPIDTPARVVEALVSGITPRTRLALVDHVTSPTGLVWPVERIVPALQARGVEVLVDGAHAPGMVALDLATLGAAFYTANCHKWLCAPKGAGFLHVRRDHRDRLLPLVTSHGATAVRPDRSRLHLEFDWPGTHDPTAYLAVPAAIRAVGGLVPGGWPEVMRRNHDLVLAARRLLAAALRIAPPAPESMLGALAAVPLPDGDPLVTPSPQWMDPLQQLLVEEHRIEVPIFPWPAPPRRLLRISAQLYNDLEEYRRLATVLSSLLG
jgi:isopenicillin-N epimerase